MTKYTGHKPKLDKRKIETPSVLPSGIDGFPFLLQEEMFHGNNLHNRSVSYTADRQKCRPRCVCIFSSWMYGNTTSHLQCSPYLQMKEAKSNYAPKFT